MELNIERQELGTNSALAYLIDTLERSEEEFGLSDATVLCNFPIYKELDGGMVRAECLLISRFHGIIAFAITSDTGANLADECISKDASLDQLISCLLSRLIRNRVIRKTRTSLRVTLTGCIFAPTASSRLNLGRNATESPLVCTEDELREFFDSVRTGSISDDIYRETIATIDGSKGLLKPKERAVPPDKVDSKGAQVMALEAEISLFDKRQRRGYSIPLDGPERIRGLAGSGKTVVLAMKAAHTHLAHPDANILLTFYTKSLYQHVRRLTTRFYRQFADTDPDWNKLYIMHAWGGQNIPGVYYEACRFHGFSPLTFSEAKQEAVRERTNPFDYVCKTLVESIEARPMFDYAFIDEGQDFSSNFINLCRLLTSKERIVLAYDEFQSIFRANPPTAAEIFGTDAKGEPNAVFRYDAVLHKCYRNPREILVCAHAMGLGLYASQPVQMLENEGHWRDIGYEVVKGVFSPGEDIEISRPEENSPLAVSSRSSLDDIVQCHVFKTISREVSWVCASIASDIADGLQPDDILVIVVDDRNFRTYSRAFFEQLSQLSPSIASHSTWDDRYGLFDFQQSGCVTISTIHKAKGNEAYMVYIVGVDAIFDHPSVISRNKLFTAMTRAKAWVRITGFAPLAQICLNELQKAKDNFPFLRFQYPSHEQITVMKRDLTQAAIEKQDAERVLDQLMSTTMSAAEITKYVTKRSKAAKKEYKDGAK